MKSNIKIFDIGIEGAQELCRNIIQNLPEYFGIPEANKHYIQGIRSRMNLAAKIADQPIGLISIEFPYTNNANIYWIGILREYHGQGIGKRLLLEACRLSKEKGAQSITVETLSPVESDENYLRTYNFYLSNGFMPLFNLKPSGYEWNMVYMMKIL